MKLNEIYYTLNKIELFEVKMTYFSKKQGLTDHIYRNSAKYTYIFYIKVALT